MGPLALLLLAVAVPKPPPENHCAVDTTQSLGADTLAQLDELCATVHAGGFGEVAVLVVSTFGKGAPRAFAEQVFAQWPIGHAENHDAALVVAALADRRAVVFLGDRYTAIGPQQLEALERGFARTLDAGPPSDALVALTRSVLRMLEREKQREAAPPPEPTPVAMPMAVKTRAAPGEAPAADGEGFNPVVVLVPLWVGGILVAGLVLGIRQRRRWRDRSRLK